MGKSVTEGDNIQFLFTDADHFNPLCRVVAYEEAGPKVNRSVSIRWARGQVDLRRGGKTRFCENETFSYESRKIIDVAQS